MPPSLLKTYDLPQHVLDVLNQSAMRHVSILARRGTLEAASMLLWTARGTRPSSGMFLFHFIFLFRFVSFLFVPFHSVSFRFIPFHAISFRSIHCSAFFVLITLLFSRPTPPSL